MSDAPTIPFGYRQVTGPSLKGDGIWNGTRFAKVKKCYPFAGDSGAVIIRKCEVVQTPLSIESPCQNPGCGQTIVDRSEETCAACGHCVKVEEEGVQTTITMRDINKLSKALHKAADAAAMDVTGVEVMDL